MNDQNNNGVQTPMQNQGVMPETTVTPVQNNEQTPMQSTPMPNAPINNSGVMPNNNQPIVPQQNINNQVNNGTVKKGPNMGLIIGLAVGIGVFFLIIVGIVTVVVLSLGKKTSSQSITTAGNTVTSINTTTNGNDQIDTTPVNETTTSVQTTTAASVANNGSIDGANFTLMGNSYSFTKTTYTELQNTVMGYIYSSSADTQLTKNKYTFQLSYVNGTKDDHWHSPQLTTYFVNGDASPKAVKDSTFFRFKIEADGYLSGNALKDQNVTLDLGSGINQNITEEQALSILGKPTYDYTSESYNYTTHEWKTNDYELKLGFNNGGLFQVDYATEKY